MEIFQKKTENTQEQGFSLVQNLSPDSDYDTSSDDEEDNTETIDEYKFKKLKDVGLNRITFGMEHGNEKFRRDVVKRHYSNKQAIELMKIPLGLL